MARPAERTSEGARAEAHADRARRFMKSALAILGETGRTDFTVLGGRGALQDLTEILLPALFHQG